MLEGLIEGTDILDLADALVMYDRLTAHLTVRVGSFHRAGTWGLDGAVSMPAWLRTHAPMAYSTSKLWCVVAVLASSSQLQWIVDSYGLVFARIVLVTV